MHTYAGPVSLTKPIFATIRHTTGTYLNRPHMQPATLLGPIAAPVLALHVCWHVLQVDYLRRLNRSGRSETVVQAFESGSVANTEEAMGEYLKALVRLDALDGSRLAATLQRGAEATFAGRSLAAAGGSYLPPPAAAASNLPWYAAGTQYGSGGGGGGGFGSAAAAALAAAGVSSANSQGAGGELGTPRNPLVVTHAEPSLMSQVCDLLVGIVGGTHSHCIAPSKA